MLLFPLGLPFIFMLNAGPSRPSEMMNLGDNSALYSKATEASWEESEKIPERIFDALYRSSPPRPRPRDRCKVDRIG